MLHASRLCPCERGNVPFADASASTVADAPASTVATIAGVAGVAVAAPPTGVIIFWSCCCR